MANALYDKGRAAFLNGSINWTSDTIKVALITSAYSNSAGAALARDQFFADVATNSGVTVGTPQTLGSKSSTAGIAGGDAAGTTFTAVVSGSTVGYIVIYKDTGTGSTSPLIALIDTVASGALSLSTNGGDIIVQWATSGNLIFKL